MSREWGTTAYEETKIQFVELVLGSEQSRCQAFALWALSHEPFLEGEELMRFGGGCGNDRPSADHVDKANQVLGLSVRTPGEPAYQAPSAAPTELTSEPTSKPTTEPTTEPASKQRKATKTRKPSARKASKSLSNMEKAILANFKDSSKLIAAYKKAQSGLKKAENDLEKAADALRDIDRDKARLLAQFDAAAEAVLNELGLLGDGGNWSD
jgi:hypothetical protein